MGFCEGTVIVAKRTKQPDMVCGLWMGFCISTVTVAKRTKQTDLWCGLLMGFCTGTVIVAKRATQTDLLCGLWMGFCEGTVTCKKSDANWLDMWFMNRFLWRYSNCFNVGSLTSRLQQQFTLREFHSVSNKPRHNYVLPFFLENMLW